MAHTAASIINFHNPTNISVVIPFKGFWSINICNMQGTVKQVLLNNDWVDESVLQYQLEISTLTTGMYMVLLRNEGNHAHWVEKFIKEA